MTDFDGSLRLGGDGEVCRFLVVLPSLVSAMPSRLVGISKVAAYCLQLGTEMHSDRSNYILHIEVIPGHWGLVFTLSPKTSLALFSQQMLLCALLDVSNSICKYFSEAISSSESLLAKGCLLS